MDPAYDECGEICGETEEPQPFYCEQCPMRLAQDEFEAECLEWLEERAKGLWQVYGFPLLLQTVLDVFKFESLPLSHQTVRAGRLISIKNQEVNRKKRIEIWNERQKRLTENQSD